MKIQINTDSDIERNDRLVQRVESVLRDDLDRFSAQIAAPRSTEHPCSHYLLLKWWRRAEGLAGLKHHNGRGFHSLRRKFATELKHIPLKDLLALGGWKDPQTVLGCYQTADLDTMREALSGRRHRRDDRGRHQSGPATPPSRNLPRGSRRGRRT